MTCGSGTPRGLDPLTRCFRCRAVSLWWSAGLFERKIDGAGISPRAVDVPAQLMFLRSARLIAPMFACWRPPARAMSSPARKAMSFMQPSTLRLAVATMRSPSWWSDRNDQFGQHGEGQAGRSGPASCSRQPNPTATSCDHTMSTGCAVRTAAYRCSADWKMRRQRCDRSG